MKLFLFSSLLLLFVYGTGFSQTLTLKHNKKDKTKTLSSVDDLIFVTKDSTFKYHQLIDLQNDHILISSIGKDTLTIPISDLKEIEKYNFKKRGFAEPFVYLGLLSAAGTIIFPIAALIDSDKDNPLQVAAIMAATTVVSGGVILIVLSKRNFDLADWKIETK